MKKSVLALFLVVGLIAFVIPQQRVLISNFSWELSGKTASYSFRIVNRTGGRIDVLVALAAEDKTEGRSGTKLHPLGYAQIQISLGPKEEKEITGVLPLLRTGDSATAISYAAEIKAPNQALQPTAPSGRG